LLIIKQKQKEMYWVFLRKTTAAHTGVSEPFKVQAKQSAGIIQTHTKAGKMKKRRTNV